MQAVRVSLQTGNFGAIDAALVSAGQLSEAWCLNLAGVIHESHGRLEIASMFYERALASDSSYWPAHKNLLRLEEFRECGQTAAPWSRIGILERFLGQAAIGEIDMLRRKIEN